MHILPLVCMQFDKFLELGAIARQGSKDERRQKSCLRLRRRGCVLGFQEGDASHTSPIIYSNLYIRIVIYSTTYSMYCDIRNILNSNC